MNKPTTITRSNYTAKRILRNAAYIVLAVAGLLAGGAFIPGALYDPRNMNLTLLLSPPMLVAIVAAFAILKFIKMDELLEPPAVAAPVQASHTPVQAPSPESDFERIQGISVASIDAYILNLDRLDSLRDEVMATYPTWTAFEDFNKAFFNVVAIHKLEEPDCIELRKLCHQAIDRLNEG
jgi:hypothetical protein